MGFAHQGTVDPGQIEGDIPSSGVKKKDHDIEFDSKTIETTPLGPGYWATGATSHAAGGDSLTASSPADVAGTDVGASSTEVSQVCSSACWCDGFWKTRETRVPCAEGGVRRKEIRLSSEKSKPAAAPARRRRPLARSRRCPCPPSAPASRARPRPGCGRVSLQ